MYVKYVFFCLGLFLQSPPPTLELYPDQFLRTIIIEFEDDFQATEGRLSLFDHQGLRSYSFPEDNVTQQQLLSQGFITLQPSKKCFLEV